MSPDETKSFWCGSVVAVIGTFILSSFLYTNFMTPDESWHRDAVRHGKAEFYLDGNQDRQWRWKE